LGKVYAVGVGPGSPKYVTEIVKEIILNCDIVVGYKYTLKTIENLIEGKEIYEITMKDQEEYYQKIVSKLGDRILVIPFTGDVNFSESEVVDRLIEIFGEVEIIPGISSIQVAASRAQVPLDKSKVIGLGQINRTNTLWHQRSLFIFESTVLILLKLKFMFLRL